MKNGGDKKSPRNGQEMAILEEKMFKYDGEDRVVSSIDLAETLNVDDHNDRYKTFIPSIDRILNGVEAGELIVVTGPTGEGKTTLLMSITKNMSQLASTQSLWFTMEVTPKQFIRKIMRSGDGKLPLFYLPNANVENHIKWIEERIIEAKVKYDAKVVFIDHIHQIFSLHRMQQNVSLEIGDLVSKIKDIAVQHDLVIFLIAHSKDNPQNASAEPRKEDIRDSGLISRLADTIIGVWRIRNEDSVDGKRRPSNLGEDDINAKVRIYKNRREGPVGTFLMQHIDGQLIELDPDDY